MAEAELFKKVLTMDSIVPMPKQLPEYIEEAKTKLNFITEMDIVSGFKTEVRGESYAFDFTLADQTNFMMKMMDASMNAASETAVQNGSPDLPGNAWCTWRVVDKEGNHFSLPLSLPEFLGLAMTAGRTKEGKLSTGWFIKGELDLCKTRKELNRIVNYFDIHRHWYEATRYKRELDKKENPTR